MKSALGLVVLAVVALLVGWSSPPREQAFGQGAPPPQMTSASDGSLIALSFAASDKVQQIAVIDPRKRVMSIYRVDATSGAIQLMSVRKIEWDLEMIQFNGVDPLPQNIQSFIEQNR